MVYTNKDSPQKAQLDKSNTYNKVIGSQYVDQRASTQLQLKQQKMMHAHSTNMAHQLSAEESEQLPEGFEAKAPAQLQEASEEKPNNTGLPNQLKAGIESLSGMSMDNVKVHYNSDKPAQLNAHAYAQGTDIHIAPGQEQHLPHEAWHVVQQAQGRVQPTMQMKAGISVNNDPGLESEADMMGARAMQASSVSDASEVSKSPVPSTSIKQFFTAPPPAPPLAGITNGALANGVPTESHVTTIHGAANDLVGTPPGAVIRGWQHILNVGAGGPWVRFHLINQTVGGLGNQANLVPTSHATNHNAAWKSFETRIKALALAQTSIHVSVDVTYPNAIPGAPLGTLASVSHYYPTWIAARVHYWNPGNGTYVLHPNQPAFAPFPLQPPAFAGVTDLSQQTAGWIRNTLMGGLINVAQANIFWNALQSGDADHYRNASIEPTPEMRLLDALDEVGLVDCMISDYGHPGNGGKRKRSGNDLPGAKVPHTSRIQILNGVYILP